MLPILMDRGFDTAMRGYDRRQVDEFLGRLDEDARAAMAERDAATARSADLAAQLASVHAQAESLRRQLRAATEHVTEDNVAPRVRELLESAKRTAVSVRAEVDSYAESTRAGADEAAHRIRAAAEAEAEEILTEATKRHADADEMFKQRLAEADRYRADVTEDAAGQVAVARAQEEQLTSEAEAERTRLNTEAAAERVRLDAEAEAERARLDGEAAERRSVADEDFQIALRVRRSDEARRSAEHLAAAQAEASGLIGAAQAQADQTTRAAALEVQRLHDQRDESHRGLLALHEHIGRIIEQTTPRQ